MSVSVVDVEILRVLQRISRGKSSSFGLGRSLLQIGSGAVGAVAIVSGDNMLEAMYQWSASLDQDQTTAVQSRFKTSSRPDLDDLIPEETQRVMERQAALNVIISSAIDLRNEAYDPQSSGYPIPSSAFRIVPPITFEELNLEFREENRRIGKALFNLGVENYDLFEKGKIVLTLLGEQMLDNDEELSIDNDTDFAVLDVVEESGVGEPAYVKSMLTKRPWMSRSEFVNSVKRFADEGHIEFFTANGERYPRVHVADAEVPEPRVDTIVDSGPEENIVPDEDDAGMDDPGEEPNEIPTLGPTEGNEEGWWDSVSSDLVKLQLYVAELRKRESTTDEELRRARDRMEKIDNIIESTSRKLEEYDELVKTLSEAKDEKKSLESGMVKLESEAEKIKEEKTSLMRRMRS